MRNVGVQCVNIGGKNVEFILFVYHFENSICIDAERYWLELLKLRLKRTAA